MSEPHRRRVQLLCAAALAVAGVAALVPPLALPAFAAVGIVAILVERRARLLVLVVGGALSLVASARFVTGEFITNIVGSGMAIGEANAVDRLREILKAEEQVRSLRWYDRDGDGRYEYASLAELTLQGGIPALPGRPDTDVPPLNPRQYRPLAPPSPSSPSAAQPEAVHLFSGNGYIYVVHLPRTADGAVDARAAADRFAAYAWPVAQGKSGNHAFAIDAHDHICETVSASPYSGSTRVPPADAAFAWEQGACGSGREGAAWVEWSARRRRR